MGKKIFWVCAILFVAIALSGCTQNNPDQKTQPTIAPPAVVSANPQSGNTQTQLINSQTLNQTPKPNQPDTSSASGAGEEDISSIEGIDSAIGELDQIE